jgi:hypothetical protein
MELIRSSETVLHIRVTGSYIPEDGRQLSWLVGFENVSVPTCNPCHIREMPGSAEPTPVINSFLYV